MAEILSGDGVLSAEVSPLDTAVPAVVHAPFPFGHEQMPRVGRHTGPPGLAEWNSISCGVFKYTYVHIIVNPSD
jgi:hypothetical protein